jgi:hypothetical protein
LSRSSVSVPRTCSSPRSASESCRRGGSHVGRGAAQAPILCSHGKRSPPNPQLLCCKSHYVAPCRSFRVLVRAGLVGSRTIYGRTWARIRIGQSERRHHSPRTKSKYPARRVTLCSTKYRSRVSEGSWCSMTIRIRRGMLKVCSPLKPSLSGYLFSPERRLTRPLTSCGQASASGSVDGPESASGRV